MKRTIFFFLPLLALILAACSASATAIKPTTAAPVPAATSTTENKTGDASKAEDASKAGDASKTGNVMKSGASSLERVDQQGAVTVTVTPLNLSKPGETLDFDVSLQTHMVDLSMDIASLSTLKTDTGVTVKATSWDGPKGGHHVMGKLAFPASQDGKSVLEGAKTLTLTIQNVDAAERTFTWEITQ